MSLSLGPKKPHPLCQEKWGSHHVERPLSSTRADGGGKTRGDSVAASSKRVASAASGSRESLGPVGTGEFWQLKRLVAQIDT